jgi:predicted lipid carrier protein YhbT
MEGDTELGLLVKNTLDALEFKPSLPAPRDVLRRLCSLLP